MPTLSVYSGIDGMAMVVKLCRGLPLGPEREPVRGGGAHREEPRHHARGRRPPRVRLAAEGRARAGRGPLQEGDLPDRGARPRRRHEADRRDAHRRGGRGHPRAYDQGVLGGIDGVEK